jgi:hypothetical protein
MHRTPRRQILTALAVAASACLLPAAAQAQQFINVLTGGTSGVYYPLGVALAKIYADKIPGVRTQVQSTKASVENLNLLALGDSVKYAWAGNAELGFPQKLGKLRGVAAVYPNYIQIVASQSSGIKTFADLKGKSLSVGAAKSGTEVNARQLFDVMNMSYADLGKTEYLPFGESVELIKNRQLDATLQSAGLGVSSIRDLANSVPVNVVAVPPEAVSKLGPPYISATIPANTYPGQTDDVPTMAIVNFLVTHEGVSEETVYQMTKQLFENLDQMVAAHNAAKAISLAKAMDGMPVPLHPGAMRYYKEKGLIK